MNFWCDTPYTTAYVRNEFLHDQQKGHGPFRQVLHRVDGYGHQ